MRQLFFNIISSSNYKYSALRMIVPPPKKKSVGRWCLYFLKGGTLQLFILTTNATLPLDGIPMSAFRGVGAMEGSRPSKKCLTLLHQDNTFVHDNAETDILFLVEGKRIATKCTFTIQAWPLLPYFVCERRRGAFMVSCQNDIITIHKIILTFD